MYHQYLRDYFQELEKESKPNVIPRSLDDLISLGSLTTEVTVRRSVVDELITLEFEDIENFYQKEDE